MRIPWNCLQNILNMSCECLENILRISWICLENILRISPGSIKKEPVMMSLNKTMNNGSQEWIWNRACRINNECYYPGCELFNCPWGVWRPAHRPVQGIHSVMHLMNCLRRGMNEGKYRWLGRCGSEMRPWTPTGWAFLFAVIGDWTSLRGVSSWAITYARMGSVTHM